MAWKTCKKDSKTVPRRKFSYNLWFASESSYTTIPSMFSQIFLAFISVFICHTQYTVALHYFAHFSPFSFFYIIKSDSVAHVDASWTFPHWRICVTHLLLASACCPWGPPVAGSQSPYCHWLYLHIILLVSGNETIFCWTLSSTCLPFALFRTHHHHHRKVSEWVNIIFTVHRTTTRHTRIHIIIHRLRVASMLLRLAFEDFSPKGIKGILCVGKKGEKRLAQCQIANDNFPALPTDYEKTVYTSG